MFLFGNMYGVSALRSMAVRSRSVKVARATTTTAEPERLILPTNKDSGELLRIRHTAAHVMAMAVQRLFPKVQVTIGPWIDNGFYYDFFNPEGKPFSDDDLVSVKKEMDKIVKAKLVVVTPFRFFFICRTC